MTNHRIGLLLAGLCAGVLGCTDIDIYPGGDMSILDGVPAGSVGGPIAAVPAAATAAIGQAGQGPWVRLLYAKALNQDQQVITESPRILTASVTGFVRGASNQGGPLVARASWGSGNSGPQQVDFDVQATSTASESGQQTSGGGSIISVPGDYLQIDIRNDGNVIPRNAVGETNLGLLGEVFATAHFAQGPRASAVPMFRTRFGAFNVGAGVVAAGAVTVLVPPFARRFTVFRNPAGAAGISIQQNGLVLPMDGPIAVAAGAPCPTFDILQSTGSITITNTGAGALQVIGVIFELGI